MCCIFENLSLKQYYFPSIATYLFYVTERMAKTRFADLQPRTSQWSSEFSKQ